jgi:predicted LPLAT superfamily acyltransferase
VLPRERRRAALEEAVARYAKRLEAYCLLAPTQWFNFFDFWQPPSE